MEVWTDRGRNKGKNKRKKNNTQTKKKTITDVYVYVPKLWAALALVLKLETLIFHGMF